MQWLVTNWFWVLVAIAFIAMHLVGHGGHGAHGGHRTDGDEGASGRRDVERDARPPHRH